MKSYLIVEIETDTDDQQKHDKLVENARSIIDSEGSGLSGYVDGWTVIGRRETKPRSGWGDQR